MNLKTCLGCGRSFPATAEHFAKAGKNKRGEAILRPRCKACHAAYAADLEAKRDRGRHEYDGGNHRRHPFVLPPACALGHWRQVPKCPDGEGLPVLVGPGGRPVIRVRGADLGPKEVCIVLR